MRMRPAIGMEVDGIGEWWEAESSEDATRGDAFGVAAHGELGRRDKLWL